jgi:hypothetical protein
MTDASVVAFTSFDDGRTFRKATLIPEDGTILAERPSVAVGPDGSISVVVSSLSQDRKRRTLSLFHSRNRGGIWHRQQVSTEPGMWSGASLAVNKRGRLGLAAYHLAPGRADRAGAGWHVRLAVFDAGRTPLWVDFASHDPVAPPGWANAPDAGTAITDGPDARFHLLWTAVKIRVPDDVIGNNTSLLRNVWSVRTLST